MRMVNGYDERRNVRRTQNSAKTGQRRMASGSGMADPRQRARIAARRRRRRRQRRIVIGVLLVLLAVIAGGIIMGVRSFTKSHARKELRSEGIAAMQEGDYDTAIQKFDEVLAMSGKKNGKFEQDVLQYRAEANYNKKDYAWALDDWQKLIETDGDNTGYKENAVLCLLETGDYDTALSLGVLQSRVYNRKAVGEIQNQQYDEALETIGQGISVDDGSMAADLAFNQAVAYEGKRDFKKALELFEAYAERFGSDETVQREITFLKTRQGSQ